MPAFKAISSRRNTLRYIEEDVASKLGKYKTDSANQVFPLPYQDRVRSYGFWAEGALHFLAILYLWLCDGNGWGNIINRWLVEGEGSPQL